MYFVLYILSPKWNLPLRSPRPRFFKGIIHFFIYLSVTDVLEFFLVIRFEGAKHNYNYHANVVLLDFWRISACLIWTWVLLTKAKISCCGREDNLRFHVTVVATGICGNLWNKLKNKSILLFAKSKIKTSRMSSACFREKCSEQNSIRSTRQ